MTPDPISADHKAPERRRPPVIAAEIPRFARDAVKFRLLLAHTRLLIGLGLAPSRARGIRGPRLWNRRS